MKEDLLYHPTVLGLIGAALAAVAVITVFVGKQIFTDSKKKSADDKALLKELLEGFGLEVPAELKESEITVIKPIKTP